MSQHPHQHLAPDGCISRSSLRAREAKRQKYGDPICPSIACVVFCHDLTNPVNGRPPYPPYQVRRKTQGAAYVAGERHTDNRENEAEEKHRRTIPQLKVAGWAVADAFSAAAWRVVQVQASDTRNQPSPIGNAASFSLLSVLPECSPETMPKSQRAYPCRPPRVGGIRPARCPAFLLVRWLPPSTRRLPTCLARTPNSPRISAPRFASRQLQVLTSRFREDYRSFPAGG